MQKATMWLGRLNRRPSPAKKLNPPRGTNILSGNTYLRNRLATRTLAVGSNAKILKAFPVGEFSGIVPSPSEPLALKQMESDNRNLEYEVRALEACQDIQSVCECLGVIEDGKYTYLAMPHYDRSLFDVVIEEGALKELQVKEIVTDVLESLMGCHEMGVAHLDVKPENLMEDGEGNNILIDFGSSHMFDCNESQESAHDTRSACGTEEYAAPELSENTFSSTKSDMYGVAATAVSLLTAEFPENGLPILEECVQSDSSLHRVISLGMRTDLDDRISCSEALKILREDE